MTSIIRNPASAAEKTYDLIIVGGGIYGVLLSLEASSRGLKSLLLEKQDFGGSTSFNSLRILHGGLRYLQSLDLNRFRESVGERSWFLRTFPELVETLPFLMPLYGTGVRRQSIFRVALQMNDLLSCSRNKGVRPDRQLPQGRVIDAVKTKELFPAVDIRGLKGGAIWYDVCMPDSQRLLMEILRWACDCGGTALNYVEACEPLKQEIQMVGVKALDRESNKFYEYKANVVINAAGPWCRQLAAGFDRDYPELFRSSLAWNVLLKKKALSDHALAVTPKNAGGRTYFLVPWKGLLFAGTGHAPWSDGPDRPKPSGEHMIKFLEDLNAAVPSLKLKQEDILQVFAGLLPVSEADSVKISTREVILDHSKHNGPMGFYSVSGVKFTTARLVAEKTLDIIQMGKGVRGNYKSRSFRPFSQMKENRGGFDLEWCAGEQGEEWNDSLRSLIKEEAVQHLDDLIFRRSTLWADAEKALELTPRIAELFGWDESRRRQEIERVHRQFAFRGVKIRSKGKL
jgi:glycerol-3-phosphate dehydrogenase